MIGTKLVGKNSLSSALLPYVEVAPDNWAKYIATPPYIEVAPDNWARYISTVRIY